MWPLVAIIGFLLAYIIFEKIVTHKREIDLIDRALPRSEKEKAVQEVKKIKRKTKKSNRKAGKRIVEEGRKSETEPQPWP